MTDLSTVYAQLMANAVAQGAVIGANGDFLGGRIDDPDSFDASGSKAGPLGFYPLTRANGTIGYFPCLARFVQIAGRPIGAVALMQMRLALRAAGRLQDAINAVAGADPNDEVAIRWGGQWVSPGDPLAVALKGALVFSDAQMANLFSAAAAIS